MKDMNCKKYDRENNKEGNNEIGRNRESEE